MTWLCQSRINLSSSICSFLLFFSFIRFSMNNFWFAILKSRTAGRSGWTRVMLRRTASYTVFKHFARLSPPLVGLDGLEPSTSRLSGARSNHLSYRPLFVSLRWCSRRPAHLSVSLPGIRPCLRDLIRASPSVMCLAFTKLHLILGCGNLPLVEMRGIEPLTPCLQSRCSPS